MSSLLQNRRAVIGLVGAGLALVLAAGWFLIVTPEKERAAKLDDEIAAVQTQITARQADLANPSAGARLRASDRYRLAKAMPDSTDMAGIVLDLSRLAQANGVSVSSIEPSSPVAATGYLAQPVGVVLEGRFKNVSRFLRDVRTLVLVRGGTLDARGRLYAVDEVDFAQPDGETGFPTVKATLTVDAFVFAPVSAAEGEEAPTTDTAATDGTVAAGATP